MSLSLLKAGSAAALLAFSLFAADPRQTFERAARALASGNLAEAQSGFEAVLKLQPSNIGALGNLGVVYSRQGRHSAAVDTYRRALKLAPHDPLLSLNAGIALLRLEDYGAAKPYFETVLKTQPTNAQAHQLLATSQIFTGEADKAIPVLEQTKAPDAGTQYLLAAAYLKLGKRDEAGRKFEQMLKSLPAAQAHHLTGRALYDSSLFDDAVAELEKARDLDAETPGLWRDLGKTYVSLRRSEDARKAFEEALKGTPTDQEVLYYLGALLVQEGDTKTGVGYLEKARSLRPEFWGTYYYLGRAAQGPQAIELLRRATSLNPNEPSAWYQLSRALSSAGKRAEAAEATRRFRALRSQSSAESEAVVLR